AIHIPIGRPVSKDIATDVTIIAMVVIISSHNPKDPIKNIKIAKTTPDTKDLKYHPSPKIIKINTHQGNQTRKASMPLMERDATKNIKSKKPDKEDAKKFTKSSTYFPSDVFISGNVPIDFTSFNC